MRKYRGKYGKCRECKHVWNVGMWIVWVRDSCKNDKAVMFSSGKAVDKPTCEDCEYFEMLGKE